MALHIISNMSMRKKIILPTVISIVFMFSFGIIFYFGLLLQKKIAEETYKKRIPVYQKSYDSKRHILLFETSLNKGIASLLNKENIDVASSWLQSAYDNELMVSENIMNGMLFYYDLSPEETRICNNIISEIGKMKESVSFVLKALKGKEMDQAMFFLKTAEKRLGPLNNHLESMIEFENNIITNQQLESNASFKKFSASFYLLLTIGIACTIISSLLISYLIVRPIMKTKNIFKDIVQGEGDLTRELNVYTKDEIGGMAEAFNSFVAKIRDVIKDASDISTELSASTEQMSATTSSFTENIQGQAASAEEISASLDEATANIATVSMNSKEQFNGLSTLIDQIKNLSEIIEKMGGNIKLTESNTENIYKNVKTRETSLHAMSESMKNISASSKEMTSIIKIIHDISEQVNLLSLNAAIEAARAGEAGKGFAVVSDEISKLADETAQSLNDIGTLIMKNEEEIEKGLQRAEEIFQAITSVIAGVDSIRAMIGDITSLMNKQLDTNNFVTANADIVKKKSEEMQIYLDEQKAVMEEILKSIANISQLTQSNAAGAEQMSGNAESVAKLVESLKSKVDFFKV